MGEKVRDPRRLWQVVHQQGYVDVPAQRTSMAVLGILMLVVGPLILVAGVIGIVAELWLGALMMLISGAALAILGVIVLLSGKKESGPVWRVDCVEIAVDGVGPIPWGQLMPPERRWVSNPRDDGNLLSTIMPLTGEGLARAEGLNELGRRAFDPGVRDTALFGLQPLEFVRIVEMRDVDQKTWVEFLTRMQATYR